MIDFSCIGIDLPYTSPDNVRVICPRCGEYHHNRKKTLSCDSERGLFQCFRCGWKRRVTGGIAWTDDQPDTSGLEAYRSKRQFAIDSVLRESLPISAESAGIARRYFRNTACCLISSERQPRRFLNPGNAMPRRQATLRGLRNPFATTCANTSMSTGHISRITTMGVDSSHSC